MHIRGRPFPPATYRSRRDAAVALLRAARDGAGPAVLLLGTPFDDPVSTLQPVAGGTRQDPWFDYYCGCHEADAALLIESLPRRKDTLFLDPGDPKKVVWDGARLQPGRAAADHFGVHACRPRADLDGAVGKALERHGAIILLWREREPGWQSRAAATWTATLGQDKVVNGEPVLIRQRMIKEPAEVACFRKAIAITAAGLKATWPLIPKMRNEAQIAAELLRHYCRDAWQHLAFPPIVGAGVNGATLHYRHDDRPLAGSGSILIDSGATWHGYCADVTRVVPRSGRFTSRRLREVYDIVLACNELGRRHARPGITLKELNDLAWKPILDAGFVRHHGLSHHIGLDVHDPSDREAPLAPGMVISNEPGVYLPDEGIGIRIEDDLLITATGNEVLTRAIPKERPAVEAWMAGG